MEPQEDGTTSAGIYCRLSLAKYGDSTKVGDQERISRNLSRQLGWRIATGVGHPEPNGAYVDNNRSAWQKNRKRPAWDQMLRDVQAGHINAIVVYHGDRLVRRPEDLADLIRLADSKSVRLASPTGTHDLDNQRLELWIRAAFAEEESTRNSERKKAGFERMRLAGKAPIPGGKGGRAFGYEHDGRTQHQAEAEFLRLTAWRLLSGGTHAAACQAAATAGISSTTGKPLTYGTLKRILLRPRTAALLSDGSPGDWEPILDPGTQCRLARLFRTQPPRQSPGGKYLLSGIALCWACRKPVQRVTNDYQPAYGCVTPRCRKAHRNMAHLDAYVTGHLIGLLNSPQVVDATARAQAWREGEHSEQLAREIATLEAGLAEAADTLSDLVNHPGVASAALAKSVREFERRIAVRKAQMTGTHSQMLNGHRGISVEQFRAMDLQVRRQLIRAAFEITILPATHRGRGFRPSDVDVNLRKG